LNCIRCDGNSTSKTGLRACNKIFEAVEYSRWKINVLRERTNVWFLFSRTKLVAGSGLVHVLLAMSKTAGDNGAESEPVSQIEEQCVKNERRNRNRTFRKETKASKQDATDETIYSSSLLDVRRYRSRMFVRRSCFEAFVDKKFETLEVKPWSNGRNILSQHRPTLLDYVEICCVLLR
jgi:hypothetical protein